MDELKHYNFVNPTTQVKSAEMVKTWESSEAYLEYLGFIIAIGDSIKGRKIRETVEISENSQKVLYLLEELKKMMSECSPVEIQTRYGNPAYRDWYDKLESNSEKLLRKSFITFIYS